MESRFGMSAVPMLKSSSTVLPLTMKPLFVSRCPLTERLPALRSPEGAVLVHPDMTTALGCRELAGTTPAWRASKSVKLRPFRGTDAIFVVVMVSPIVVSVVSTWRPDSETSTAVLCSPSSSFRSISSALPVSRISPARISRAKSGLMGLDLILAGR